jgi:ornithine cyclodeaminase
LGHIGELKIPLESGAMDRSHLRADYYDLEAFQASPDDITVFKNGGGAHLDLMTARYVLDQWPARAGAAALDKLGNARAGRV